MKKQWAAFVLAGMMVLSLVGCGEEKKPTGTVNGNGDVTQNDGANAGAKAKSAVPGNEKGRTWESDVRSGNRETNFNNNNGSTFGGIGEDNTIYDGMGGYRVDRTATWQQMLENGRVHDTDGFLLDGENTAW